MADETMDMNAAIDMAVDTATTMGLGEEIPAEEAQAETPEVEAEAPAPDAETPAEDAPEEVEASDLAAQLADLTRDEVLQTKPGQGLWAENKRLRDENRQLKASKPPAAQVEAEEAPAEDAPDPLDGLAEDDLVEVRHVKGMVAAEVAKALKPVSERLSRTDRTDRQQVMATGLAALAAEQKAGEIPAGVNTSSIVNKAVAELSKDDPSQLNILLSKPDPVRAIWKFANAFMPNVQAEVAAASKAKADTRAERLAQGRSPDTGEEPGDINDFIADLNAP